MARIEVREAIEHVLDHLVISHTLNDGEVIETLLGEHVRMLEEAQIHDAMVEQSVRLAWQVIVTCPHKDPEDGCCQHPDNMSPECDEHACPLFA